ncbi:hypothetical protein C0991_008044, partial [Blastosporella zonata]
GTEEGSSQPTIPSLELQRVRGEKPHAWKVYRPDDPPDTMASSPSVARGLGRGGRRKRGPHPRDGPDVRAAAKRQKHEATQRKASPDCPTPFRKRLGGPCRYGCGSKRYARHDWHHMAPHYITCEKCPESVRNDAIADRNKRKQQKGARIKAQEATAGGFEVPVLPVALQADGYRETSLSRPMLNIPLPHSGVSTREVESTSEYALPYPSSTYLTPNHDTWSMIQPTQMADTSYNNHPTSVPGDVPSSPFFNSSPLPSLHADNGYKNFNVPQQMLINIMHWRDFIARTNYVGAPYQMHQQNNIQQYEDTPIAYPPYMFSVDFNAQQTLAVPQFHGGYETNNLVDVPWQMAQSVSWPQTMQQLQMPQGNYSGQQMSVAESIYIG